MRRTVGALPLAVLLMAQPVMAGGLKLDAAIVVAGQGGMVPMSDMLIVLILVALAPCALAFGLWFGKRSGARVIELAEVRRLRALIEEGASSIAWIDDFTEGGEAAWDALCAEAEAIRKERE